MKPPLEHIRVSSQARDQLIKLKRTTGIKNWNTLCRWAFCMSLGDSARPLTMEIKADSNIEMTWRVFTGEDSDIYLGLFALRCRKDGIPPNDTHALANEFRLHLHRGIAMLASARNISGISQMMTRLIK